jgi:DNA repair protein RecO (recombination protein O)
MRAQAQPAIVTPALVLRVVNFGESDRVVTLLTAAHGKLSVLARGARASKRRFGAALSPFGYGEATLRERRGQELWLLEELHTSRGFARLPQELGRFSHACYALELCLHLCPPHEPEPEVLQLTLRLFEYLDGLPLEDKPAAEALRVYELRLLRAVGLALQLRECAACGHDVPEHPYVPFDVSRGGVLCPDSCWLGPIPTHIGQHGGGLAAEVRRALQQLEELPLDPELLTALSLPRPVQRACRELLVTVLQHHLGRNLRAVEFIAKLNAAGIAGA